MPIDYFISKWGCKYDYCMQGTKETYSKKTVRLWFEYCLLVDREGVKIYSRKNLVS